MVIIPNGQDTIKYASTRAALAGSNQRLQEGKGEKGKNKVEKGKKKGKRKKRGNEKLRKKEKRKERKEKGKEPVAQRHHMVSGTLALLRFW